MAHQTGYWLNGEFVETDTEVKTGKEILIAAGKDPDRTLVAVDPRGERIILNKDQAIDAKRHAQLEDLPSFVYG
jgi:hypothetical protein